MAKSTFVFSATDQVTPQLAKINESLNKFEGQYKKIGDSLKATVGIAAAGAALKQLGDMATFAFGKFAESQSQLLKLEAQLRTSSSALGLSVSNLKTLANTIEGYSGIDDMEILKSISLMQTFNNVRGDVFEESIKQAANLSEVFGSIEMATKQLGDALNDPVNGLAKLDKAQITFTETEKKHYEQLVKTGHLYDAQVEILAKVKASYNGIAESINSGAQGAINNLNNTWDDSMKGLGKAVAEFAEPAIRSLTEQLNNLNASVALAGVSKDQAGAVDELATLSRNRPTTTEDLNKLLATAKKKYELLEKSGYDIDTQFSAYQTKMAEIQKVIANVTKAGADDATIGMWKEQLGVLQKQADKLSQIRTLRDSISSNERRNAQLQANSNAQKTYYDNQPTSTATPTGGSTYDDVQDAIWDKQATRQYQREKASTQAIGTLYEELNEKRRSGVFKFVASASEANDKWIADSKKAIDAVSSLMDSLSPAFSQITALFATLSSQEQEAAKARLDSMETELELYQSGYEARLAAAKAAGQDTAQMEVDYANEVYSKKQAIAEEERNQKKKAWEAEKAANLTNAIMSGATAAIKAWELLPNIPLAVTAGALALAATTANVALIAGQQMPAFASGGIVPGSSYSGDKVLVRANSEELILNKSQQSNLYNAIANNNLGSGGTTILFYLIDPTTNSTTPITKEYVQRFWDVEKLLKRDLAS